jgi:CheY-like chemotaxis protein
VAEPKTILIAEDDENDIFFLKRILLRLGDYKVQIVRDGNEAVRYLAGEGEFHDRSAFPLPYCLIVDLGLPQKDGLEILEWLRAHPRHSSIPVLVCSGSQFPEHIERAQRLGAVSFLNKPPDLPQVSLFMDRVRKNRSAPSNIFLTS